MPALEIALATVNSSRYLSEQLESLFRQTNQDFELLIADDGSDDETLQIIAGFQDLHPSRIRLIEFPEQAGGARANFARLAEHLSADYAMFCDHDDVWLPDKVAFSLAEIQQEEALFGVATPILFHTDLCVTGPDLKVWNPSFWKYTNTRPERNSFGDLLMTSTVAGCTMIANRALYQLALPIPQSVPMHDSWMALVAAAFGRIRYSRKATILYRQHDRNVFGATKWGPRHILRRIAGTLAGDGVRRLQWQIDQAQTFLDRFGPRLDSKQRAKAATLANLWSRTHILRFPALANQGLLKHSWLRSTALAYTVTSYRDNLVHR